MFDIKSGDEVGLFEVSAKFMGVAMEKVELVFQVREHSLAGVSQTKSKAKVHLMGAW